MMYALARSGKVRSRDVLKNDTYLCVHLDLMVEKLSTPSRQQLPHRIPLTKVNNDTAIIDLTNLSDSE